MKNKESAGGRLYVKYCGGCNPAYSRAELVRLLAAALGAEVTYSAADAEGADWRVVVCGCPRCCAQAPGGAVAVCQWEEPARLAARLITGG